jgi:CRP-like cAMP-binding protein
MDYPELHRIFNKVSPITSSAWNAFTGLFREESYPKNKMIIREGQYVSSCSFLLDGVIRVYFENDGKEYNKTFFIPGTFVAALTSLVRKEPSRINLQALTPVQMVSFPWRDFCTLFNGYRSLETFYRVMLEQIWVKKELHDIRMVTNDATTNYLIFREEFPGLEQMIPQYHIASYLGITPIQLSRIRSSLAKDDVSVEKSRL